MEFRAEFFNALNHSNYLLVGRIVNDPTFGQVLSQFFGGITDPATDQRL